MLLIVCGVVLGLLTNLATTFYFTYMTGRGAGEDAVPLPADMVLEPVSDDYAHHPDVLYYEDVLVLTANTAAGVHEILVLPVGSRFLGGYRLLAGHWPQTAAELAVPCGWVARSGVNLGETTRVTVRFGGFASTTEFVVCGVFESPFPTYDLPLMNPDGHQRTGGYGRRRVFLAVRPGVDLERLAARLARQQTAVAETPTLVAQGRNTQRWEEIYGDAMAWSYTLSTMVLVICSLGMMNMMALSVDERRPEIAILKTFGVKNPSIFLLFLAESAAVAVLAVVVALGLFGLATTGLFLVGQVPRAGLTWPLVRNACVAASVVAFVPPFYPAGLGMGLSAVRLLQGR